MPASEHAELPPLSDPGKDDRAARGVPIVPSFDGYRAFAILAIVVFHILLNSGVAERAGGSLGGQLIWATGPQFVDILFVVSGFVVYLPTVAQGGRFGSVSAYAIRRGARLLPAYWASLAVMVVVMATQPGVSLPGFGDLASNVSGQQTTVQMFWSNVPIGFGFDTPIWTLTLEIGFYVVLPFIAAAFFRRPIVGLAIALAIAVLWREAFANIDTVVGWFGGDVSLGRALELEFNSLNQLPSWAFSFAAGMAGAWAYVQLPQRFGPETVERIASRLVIPAALLFALFVFLAGHRARSAGAEFPNSLPLVDIRQSSAISIGYTATLALTMVTLALSRWRLGNPFAHPLARRLGDISYGIFLIQAPILWLFVFHASLPDDGSLGAFAIWTAAVLPASVLYGYLSARFLEQPIRRWAHRFGRQAQARSEARLSGVAQKAG